MDYAPEVNGNHLVAHYTSDPKTFGGIVFPHPPARLQPELRRHC
jgi:hypothetical protein